MQTIYAITHVSKEVEIDSYTEGSIGKRTCTMDEPLNITADTLPALLRAVGDHYGLMIAPAECSVCGLSPDYVTFSRTENAEGDEPSKREMDLWREGECRLWAVDYIFEIERRLVSPAITPEEWASAGVRTE